MSGYQSGCVGGWIFYAAMYNILSMPSQLSFDFSLVACMHILDPMAAGKIIQIGDSGSSL